MARLGTARAYPSLKKIVLVVVVILLLILPLAVPSQYTIFVVTIGLVYATLAASWDFLSGYAGLLSFGHAGMFGMGAYGAIIATDRFGVPPALGLLCGAAGGAAIAVVMAILTLRLNGAYVALMTLAVAQITYIIILLGGDLTGGALGIVGYEGLLPGNSAIGYFYAALAMVVLAAVGLAILGRSSYGLTLKALRDDQVKAQTMGVNINRTKLSVFAISGAVAGLAGGFYAYLIGVLTVGVFDAVAFAGLVIGMAVMGGIGSIWGPAIFAVLYWYVASYLEDSLGPGYNALILGALIIATMVFLPKGIWNSLVIRRKAREAAPSGVDEVQEVRA
jgi:branched-chain amino acid transport system permease protein